MKSIFVMLGIVLIVLTVKSVEISGHGHESHSNQCTDCKKEDNIFMGDHNDVNKYHEDDKHIEHHAHNRDFVENHGHGPHNQDFVENHKHRNRGHGHH
ncbi:unnamed protein product [Chironomus riparius]|uniref:Uncharacterized protein n=1 Tax=Chironomus riparius TaxID=315576 RepID=A0A9N9WPI6_9DIPT|nr:unnamed protein product [Chironomus riparius]